MSDDDTPSNERAVKHHSGEFPPWLDMLFARTDRIERSIGKVGDKLASHIVDDATLAADVKALTTRQTNDDADKRSSHVGMRIALFSSIVSPIAVILVALWKH